MAETPYAETEALLAVLNADQGELNRILGDLLPGELRALESSATRLAAAAAAEAAQRGSVR